MSNKKDQKKLDQLQAYLMRPRSIAQIMKRCKISKRSAYRYLEYLQEKGIELWRQVGNPVLFFIEKK